MQTEKQYLMDVYGYTSDEANYLLQQQEEAGKTHDS
jgi:hypothetical protein